MYMERRGDEVMCVHKRAEVERGRIVLEQRRKRAAARHFRGYGAKERKEEQEKEEKQENEEE